MHATRATTLPGVTSQVREYSNLDLAPQNILTIAFRPTSNLLCRDLPALPAAFSSSVPERSSMHAIC